VGLYTVILDFAGGTYIYQVKASSPTEALVSWAKSLNVAEVTGLGPNSKDRLVALAEEEANETAALTGMVNTWCWTAHIQKKLMLVNIIKTSASTNR
jgi:hypothetical protein